MSKTLQESMENFQDFEPTRVERNGQAYVETYNFIKEEVERHLVKYRKLERLNQTGRLTRDQLDELLRRYHDYVIAGKYKAHYRQVGLKSKEGNIFEHVIPTRTVRNLLISGVWNVDQAMNPPTCLLDRTSNDLLSSLKLTKSTPNTWFFWRRYRDLNIKIETYDGTPVDQETWDWRTHCEYFNILL